MFSRIHVDDLVTALEASLTRVQGRDAVYNLCDDLPSPPQDVIAHAAALLGIEPPPETVFTEAETPAASRRFFAESKRVSNAHAKAELTWRPAYPTYRRGVRRRVDAINDRRQFLPPHWREVAAKPPAGTPPATADVAGKWVPP